MPSLVLASSSPRRSEILEQIGFTPEFIHPANIDESPLKKELPKQLVVRLAQLKAWHVAAYYPGHVVLGADTVISVGRKILNKPHDADEALAHITRLSGRRHRVYSGICVIYKERVWERVSVTLVKFKRISQEEAKVFIASNEWHGKSGGYAIQGLASSFVEWIRGTETSIRGLPAREVYQLLKAAGVKSSITI